MNTRSRTSDAPTTTSKVRRVVVVGGGLAGAKALEELRSLGYDGDLTLIGNETHAPYERPPLSKEIRAGAVAVAG